MKKKLIIAVALLLVVSIVCFAGCSLLTSSTDSLVSSDSGSSSSSSSSSSSTTTNKTTYTDVTKTELEEALTQYREIAETLSKRVSDLEEAVRQAIASSKTNIGAYAVTYVDSVMNISCLESQYNLGCQGTGFVITEDGYVITNNHVIYYEETVYDTDNIQRGWFGITYGTKKVSGVYSSIKAVFDPTSKYYNDEKAYTLKFVYRDPDYDLALCKIEEVVPVGDTWTAIPFYDGEVVRGDELLVLGNAQGYGLSATSGLVSATGKTFTDYPKLTFIQTDAAINGGNSGGPAINIYGGLIGVVNSKFVSTNIENMGFAIELTKLKEFLTAAQTSENITVSYKTVSATKITIGGSEEDTQTQEPLAA